MGALGFGKWIGTVAAASALALALGSSASATLPGKNGPLLIDTYIEDESSSLWTSIFTATERGKFRALLAGSSERSSYDPAVSPNGRRIAYTRYPGNKLWLGSTKAPGKAKQITFGNEEVSSEGALFAPDGKSIYYEATGPNDSWAIKRYFLRTKNNRTYAVKGKENWDLSGISPNGRLVIFHRGEEHSSKIMLLDTRSGKTRAFRSKATALFDGDISPDGKRIAFGVQAGSAHSIDLYTARLNGKGVRRLTRNGKVNYLPVYSPDGRKIAFVQGADEKKKIGILTLKTGRVRYIDPPGSYVQIEQWLAMEPGGAGLESARAGR